MPDASPSMDWAVSGLAQLFDTVITAAGRSGDLSENDREHFAETGAAAFTAGMSLSQLIGTYLSGAAEIWEHALSVADQADTVELGRALRRVSDQAVGSLAEGFESAQRLSIRAEESLRRTFFDDILATDTEPSLLADLADRVAFPSFDHAVVAVARSSRDITDGGPAHRRVRTELEARAPQRDFWVTTEHGKVVVIAIDTSPRDIGALLSNSSGMVGDPTWRVGVGNSVGTIHAVGQSYQAALEALKIGGAFELPSPTEFDRILPQRLLAADAAVAEALARSVVAPLLAKSTSELMATLSSFIEHGGNMAAVARDLNIGARTVSYRLERIGQLTGYSPTTPSERFVLELAYRALPLITPRPRRARSTPKQR